MVVLPFDSILPLLSNFILWNFIRKSLKQFQLFILFVVVVVLSFFCLLIIIVVYLIGHTK